MMRDFSVLLAVVALGVLSMIDMGSAQLEPYANGTCDHRRPAGTNVTRRNLTDLMKDEDEVQRLRDAFAKLMALDKTNPEKNCTYFNVAKHHGWFTATCQHETTTCFQHGFLQWHRLYMYEMEQALRTVDSNISLPYWDFTSIYSPKPTTPVQDLLPSIVKEKFYFNKKTNKTEYNPLYSYRIPSIEGANESPPSPGANTTRNQDVEGYTPLQTVRDGICDAFRQHQFDQFSLHFECPHNLMHVFIGGFADVYTTSSQTWTAFDPLFWFYHANIDRIWAGWELTNNDTSSFLPKDHRSYPFIDWTFEEVSDYKKTMYYNYDHPFKVTDFHCDAPHAGEKALVAQFTKLPISENKPYMVRLIVDPHRLTGNASANTILTNNHIVGEIGMWGTMKVACQSPNCTSWCRKLLKLPQMQMNLGDFDDFYSQPFDVSDALFLDVYGKGQDPIDLSAGIAANDLRNVINDRQNLCSTRNKRDCEDACLPSVPNPQISYGTVLSKEDYLNLVQVSDDQKAVFIKWHPISPLQAEYPPVNVAAGATLIFHYDIADHSVAQVFEYEFKQCAPFFQPHCIPKPGVTGEFNCTIQLPQTTNTTFFFLCTQSDHCQTRGMRIRVKVGNGENVPCKTPPASECADRPCPANTLCRLEHGTIIYNCVKGYKLRGFTTSICQKDGLWTSPPPACVLEADCTGRACPDHATCTPADAVTHSSGTAVAYKCDDGYTLDGASESHCLDGVWTTEVPKCHCA